MFVEMIEHMKVTENCGLPGLNPERGLAAGELWGKSRNLGGLAWRRALETPFSILSFYSSVIGAQNRKGKKKV